ncbi:Ropporin-1-like protein [Entophlyctis luteolus]|nr:Ropporin-1-like protein [Entophlyctis luteolus]
MADIKEPIYCAEQIKIPADLPDILKNYTKHIIRTQPADIMTCSAEYFARLAKQRTQMGKKLTNHQLEAFYLKVSKLDRDMITRKEIEDACNHASVTSVQVNDVITFVAGWTLVATIESVCHLLSDNGIVPTGPLMEIITFMSERDPSQDSSKIQNLLKTIGSSGPTVNADQVMVTVRKEVK